MQPCTAERPRGTVAFFPTQATGSEPTRTFVEPCGTSRTSIAGPHEPGAAHAGECGGAAASRNPGRTKVQLCTSRAFAVRYIGVPEWLNGATQVRSQLGGVLSAQPGHRAAAVSLV